MGDGGRGVSCGVSVGVRCGGKVKREGTRHRTGGTTAVKCQKLHGLPYGVGRSTTARPRSARVFPYGRDPLQAAHGNLQPRRGRVAK